MIGDAAFLVGDDHFNAVGQDGLLQSSLVTVAIGGREFHEFDRRGGRHPFDDVVDVHDGVLIAEHIFVEAGVVLVAGHRGGAVFEDDVGDVLAGFDGVADRDLAGMEEGAIAHEDELFVADEGIDAAAGAAAKAHAGIIVHELLGGGEHEHGVAAGVAMRDQIDGGAVVDALHVGRIGQIFADFQEDGG